MKKIFCLTVLLLACMAAVAQVKIVLSPDEFGCDISAAQYGIFFEEINHAADGGLWSELIRNRSFEDNESEPTAWRGQNGTTISIATDNPMNSAQKNYLHITPSGTCSSVINDGYWGMRVDSQPSFELTFFVRADEPFTTMTAAQLLDADNKPLYSGSAIINVETEWQKYTVELQPSPRLSLSTIQKAHFELHTIASTAFDIDVVSLMPTETYKGHGCRKDLAQMLEDLKPRFMRFPGGCYIEGQYANGERNRFEWKKTIGPIEERPGHWNINWNYRSSDAFGYYEMLQLSEDLGAAPLFVVNVGLGHGWYQDIDDLDDFIQEALDAIEYANGDTTTTWGAMRAANGHPEPFGLKYIEIGNENYNYSFTDNNDQSYQYAERYYKFYTAIKAAYPDIVCIGNVESWGTDNPSWRNDYPVDAVDEHYYRSPEWFAARYEKYDSYDRSRPKVYVGEYAVTDGYGTTGNIAAALGEAIYMMGIERNSDMVPMASYAPIFVNVNDQKWMPDMIRFDTDYSYGTPSYYVQKLMSQKLGTQNIAFTESGNNSMATDTYAGLSTWQTSALFSDYKISKDGVVVYSAPFDETAPWTDLSGTFNEQDGVLAQISTSMTGLLYLNEHVTLGDNYTIEVKATKTDGAEGFLIAFGYSDPDNYCWWNLGGWSNTRHTIEVCTNGVKTQYDTKNASLTTGVTYDLRIEVMGNSIKCYIDDELIHNVVLPMERKIYASATRDAGKLYVKLVNPNGESYNTTLSTRGYSASNIVMTQMKGNSSQDENTLTDMYAVAPQSTTLSAYGTNIILTLPAYSFNIVEMDITLGEDTSLGLMPQEGTYYLMDADKGLYLSRGSNWGTRATMSRLGIPVQITNISEDKYRLRYCDKNNAYLGNLTYPYTDVTEGEHTQWRFRDAGNGYLWLENTESGTSFISAAADEGCSFTDDTAQATRFRLVSVTEYEQALQQLNPLTLEMADCMGADMTDLMVNPTMELGIDGWTNTFHNFNGSGTPVEVRPTNRVALNEAYELMGDITQTISGLKPNGVYRFSIQAFFRASTSALCNAAAEEGIALGNAYLICGDATAILKPWTTDRDAATNLPNTMETTAESFAQGLYNNVIVGRADDAGNLTVGLGVGHRNTSQWLIWGGATLEELTEPVDYTDHIVNPSFESNITTGWTNNGMQRQNNNETRAGKTETYYCEKWTEKDYLDDASITQTVSGLQDGQYRVTAYCHAQKANGDMNTTGVYLMAGTDTVEVTTSGIYTVVATAAGGQLTIGFGCRQTDAKWITVDNFQMKWIGSSDENNRATLQALIEKLQLLLDTKTILPQQLRDEASVVITTALQASTADEVTQSITAVSAKYDQLDAYRIPVERNDNCNAYLFAYFPNNYDENLYYALSTDGFNYTPLNNGNRILNSADFTISGGIRDPHILRGEDGLFRMVSTDMVSANGWSSNRGIVMSTSTDLIHWTHSTVHFPTRFPDGWSSVTRVWAPETVYDRESGKYMVYFSLLTSDDGTCNYDKVFYCYANDDFTDLIDYPVFLFDRGSATIDADIIFDETDQLYHMIYKNEGINSISHVTAPYLTARSGETPGSQWGEWGGAIQQTSVAVEGGGIFRLIDENTYVVMYDCYGSGYYQFCTTTDWKTYTLQAQTTTSGAFTPRHGSVTPLHPAETRALLDAFPTDGFDIDCTDPTGIKSLNATLDDSPIYDLSGRRIPNMSATDSHVIIKDGNKYITK